ncbi:LuxR C-terminal-related transcriptional regulator [Streptomyces sp. SS7]|uniref:response regulator transcription factor n=1 Tax=Streptomyces sp. SS7 TaxID=3108485 RepID=UPI0030ECE909
MTRGRGPQQWCGKGLHSFDDPENVYLSREANGRVKRACRPCTRERCRKPFRPYLNYRPTPQQLAILQCLADGLTVEETAEHMQFSVANIAGHLQSVHRKYGVKNHAAAVAQALKRGLIRPDKATAKRLPYRIPRKHVEALRVLMRSERMAYRPYDKRLPELLDACMSWTEAHAVSVLWAAGRLTNKDVPQTRNQYRRWSERRKPKEDAATWVQSMGGA